MLGLLGKNSSAHIKRAILYHIYVTERVHLFFCHVGYTGRIISCMFAHFLVPFTRRMWSVPGYSGGLVESWVAFGKTWMTVIPEGCLKCLAAGLWPGAAGIV